MLIPPPTSLEGWRDLQTLLVVNGKVNLNPFEERVLWIMSGLVLSSGALYTASWLIRLYTNRQSATWLFARDKKGYIRPNVSSVLPITLAVYSLVEFGAILALQRNNGRVPAAAPLALQSLANIWLFVPSWIKTWITVYAVPASTFKLPGRASNSGLRRTSPFVFNAFYIAFPCLTTLLSTIDLAVRWIRQSDLRSRYWVVLDELAFIIDRAEAGDAEAVRPITAQALQHIQELVDIQASILSTARLHASMVAAVLLFKAILFLVATGLILVGLYRQIRIFRSSMRNHRALVAVQGADLDPRPSRSVAWDVGSKTEAGRSRSSSDAASEESRGWRTWLPTTKAGLLETSTWEHRVDVYGVQLKAGETGTSEYTMLKRISRQLQRYLVNTMWQALLIFCVDMALLVLNMLIALNTFGVPMRTTPVNMLRVSILWSAWCFSGGAGILLGVLACVVALWPPPDLPTAPIAAPETDSDIELPTLPRAALHSSARADIPVALQFSPGSPVRPGGFAGGGGGAPPPPPEPRKIRGMASYLEHQRTNDSE